MILSYSGTIVVPKGESEKIKVQVRVQDPSPLIRAATYTAYLPTLETMSNTQYIAYEAFYWSLWRLKKAERE